MSDYIDRPIFHGLRISFVYFTTAENRPFPVENQQNKMVRIKIIFKNLTISMSSSVCAFNKWLDYEADISFDQYLHCSLVLINCKTPKLCHINWCCSPQN